MNWVRFAIFCIVHSECWLLHWNILLYLFFGLIISLAHHSWYLSGESCCRSLASEHRFFNTVSFTVWSLAMCVSVCACISIWIWCSLLSCQVGLALLIRDIYPRTHELQFYVQRKCQECAKKTLFTSGSNAENWKRKKQKNYVEKKQRNRASTWRHSPKPSHAASNGRKSISFRFLICNMN